MASPGGNLGQIDSFQTMHDVTSHARRPRLSTSRENKDTLRLNGVFEAGLGVRRTVILVMKILRGLPHSLHLKIGSTFLKVEESASTVCPRCEAPEGIEPGSICWSNPVQVVLSAPIRACCGPGCGDILINQRLQENHP